MLDPYINSLEESFEIKTLDIVDGRLLLIINRFEEFDMVLSGMSTLEVLEYSPDKKEIRSVDKYDHLSRALSAVLSEQGLFTLEEKNLSRLPNKCPEQVYC